MQLDRDSSTRLNLVRFPLIVGVVYIHSYLSVVEFGGTFAELNPTGLFTKYIRDFVSGGLAGIAVPLFFFMSGFLFFYGIQWSGSAFFKKVKTRIKTLLVPLLIWNIFYLIIVAIAQNLPFTSRYFAGGIPDIVNSNFFEYFNLIIGINRDPIAFQFWYIRALIVLVLLTPVFHLMHKRTAYIFLVLFFGLWFFDVWPSVLFVVHSATPVFFFYAGSILAIKKRTPFLLDNLGTVFCMICMIFFITYTIYQEQLFSSFLQKAGVLTGIFAVFYTTKFLLIKERIKALFLWLGTASFFVFALHEPLMGFCQRVAITLHSPINDITKLLYYFGIPLVIILISILVYKFLISTLPRFTTLITGGRSDHADVKVEPILPLVDRN